MDRLTEAVVTICVGVIGLATLAVLVSKNANTSGVISAGGNAFSQGIGAAILPVTGGTNNALAGNFGTSGLSSLNMGGISF